ncbi:MAG: sigma 54-dependent transcriptional regulator, partial [Lentisphaeraceae bacterium]|nr:sigma 54-dependent transcriptional regulator [Lentisphaeraceae bacterium]
MKKKVLIGLLGVNKDTKGKGSRWEKWRPTVSLFQHDDIIFDRLELLYQDHYSVLADMVGNDISRISSETQTNHHLITLNNPWDFEEVYSMLHDFARHYKFKDDEEYYLHITTGTHVAQICLFLLTESRHFPALLIQTSP